MDTRAAPLPSHIGRFRIDALIGAGGMGEVYKGFDPTLKRTVAVKTVRGDIDQPEYLTRLYREAQACARLQHPNIVTVYEAGEIGGVVYIAMEFLKGEDLAGALRRGGLSFESRLQILGQILDALQHAHTEGVIHRDIKPSNVFVQPDGTVKIVDFGLAHVLLSETITASATVLGTPHYASPEQLRAQSVDTRTDIYSTGALAYEVVTGRRPFQVAENDSVAALVLRVVSEPLPPMDVVWSRRFPEIERFVARAMAKNPADRYQSAADMRQAIATFLASSREAFTAVAAQISGPEAETATRLPSSATSQSVRSSTDSTGPAPHTWWWFGGAAAAIVAIAAFLYQPSPAGVSDVATVSAGLPPAPAPAAPATTEPPAPSSAAGAPAIKTDRPEAGPGSTPPSRPIVSPAAAAPPPSAGGGEPAPVRVELSAKQLFAGQAGSPITNTGLRFRLSQQSSTGAEADVDPAAITFKSGDRVRFTFESNIDGHLYVVQQGSSGRWTVLFPNPQINGGRNQIKRSEQYQVPNDDWFLFDDNPGTEQVFVFLSREPLTQLPGFDRPVTRLESVRASVVEDLQRTVRPRDLIFEKDTTSKAAPGAKSPQATYVVNRDEVGKTVAATIQLTHGQ